MMSLKDNTNNDRLDRKQVSQRYVSLIKALDDSYVIALDAPWGSGKTTLLKYIEEDLEQENIAYVNYNAWENDYTEEPFLSLISEFNTQVKEKKYLPNIAKFNTFKEVSYKVSKKVVPSIVKGVTQLFIGSDAVKDIESGAKEIIESVISDASTTVDDIFDSIETSKQSRKKFKKELRKITSAIIEKKHNKMVFIIDELDRCKPTFAIELLENIKHLFDVENIIFLISVDKVQLSESIKSVYGSGFDSMGYLKRFFNFDLHLKFNEDTFFIEDKCKNILKCSVDDIGGKNLVLEAFSVMKLSLRDYQQILVEIYLLDKMSRIQDKELYFVLLCLKYKFIESYEFVKNNRNIEIGDITTKISRICDEPRFIFFRKIYRVSDRDKSCLSESFYEAIQIIESTLK